MTTDHLSDSTSYTVNTFEHVRTRGLGGGGPVLGGHPDPDPDPTPMNPTIPAPPRKVFCTVDSHHSMSITISIDNTSLTQEQLEIV